MHDIVNQYLQHSWINSKSFAECLTHSILLDASFRSQTSYYISHQCMGDTHDIFNTNMLDPAKRADLERSGWSQSGKPSPILYRANNSGWRSDHFTADPSIVFFGCSFTYGVGMHEDDIWPTRVSNHFNMKCCNLGTPAQNLSASSLYTSLWMENEIPNAKAFVIKLQAPNRITFYMPDEPRNKEGTMYLWNLTHSIADLQPNQVEKNFLKRLITSVKPTSQLMDLKDLILITSYAEKHNIPVIFADSTQDKYFNKPGEHVARDWGHPGIEWQDAMTNSTIKQLEHILR